MNVLKLILFLVLSLFIFNVEAQDIQGDTIVCEDSYRYYTFPMEDSLMYSWGVTGGNLVDAHGDTLEVIWTTNSHGNIHLIESDTSGVLNEYNLAITLFPLPAPTIVPSFLSNCTELIIIDGIKDSEYLSDEDCYSVCDSTAMTFYALGESGSTFEWEVLGEYDILFWENDSIRLIWTETGAASIVLKETTINGCEQYVSFCLDINENPNASFDINHPDVVGSTLTIGNGQGVQFVNTTVLEESGGEIGWYIDGVFVASGSMPTLDFMDTGTYEVTMVVNNNCNCSDTARAIVIVDTLSIASIECPGVVCEGSTVTYSTDSECTPYNFSVIGSTDFVVSGNSVTVNWNAVDSTGYGQVVLDGSTCNGIYGGSSVINIPVILDSVPIEGNDMVCSYADYLNYSIPFWPGTGYAWRIVSQNGNAELFDEYSSQVILQVNDATGELELEVDYYNELLQCGGVSTITISIREELELTGPNVVCASEVFTFDASPNNSSNPYVWHVDLDEQIGQTASSFNHSIATAGEYTIIVENSDYCNVAGRRIYVAEVPPTPSVIIGEDSICIDNYYVYSTQLISSDFYSEWTIIDGTDVIVDQGIEIGYKFNSTGPYQVSVRYYNVDNPNCSSANLTMDVHLAAPIAVAIIGPDTVCANSTSIYRSNLLGAEDYFWELSNPAIGSIFNATSDSIVIQWNDVNSSDVFLYLRANSCGHLVRDTLLIHVNEGPVPNIVIPDTLCQGAVLYIEETNIGSGTFNWSTSPSSTIIGDYGHAIDVIYNTAGTHFVNLSIENPEGCITIADAVVSFDIAPEPVAHISKDTGNVVYCISEYDSLGVDDIYVRFVRTSQSDPSYSYQWLCNGDPIAGTVNQDILTVTSSTICISTNSVGVAHYQLMVTDTSTGCFKLSNVLAIEIDSCMPPACVSEPIALNASATRFCDSVYFSSSIFPSQFFHSVNWLIGDYNINTTQPSFGHKYTKSGIYTIRNRTYFYANDGSSIPDSSILCFQDTVFDIAIPAIPDFEYTFACDVNNDMKVSFERTTDFVAVYTSFAATNWVLVDSATSAVVYNGTTPPNNLSGNTYYVTMTEVYSFDNGTIVITNDTCSVTRKIHIPSPAEADFTFAPSPVCEGTPIFFTDASQGEIISWHWSYGDFTSSLLQNSVRTYGNNSSNPIPRDVVLTIEDEYGCLSQKIDYLTVNPDNFHQIIIGDSIACKGEVVVLGTVFGPSPPYTSSTSPITYAWSTGATTDTIHVSETGSYTVSMTDAYGCVESSSFPVLFFNAPAATIEGPSLVCSYTDFSLSGPQYGNLTYLWEHSTDEVVWDSLSLSSTYYGVGNESATYYNGSSFQWDDSVNHYIRLIINTNIAGVLSCPDTSDVFVIAVLPPLSLPEIAVDYACALPVTLQFVNVDEYVQPIYHWSTGQVNVDSIRTGFSGLYALSLRDSFGCSIRNTFTLEALPSIGNVGMGCVTVCDTVLPATVYTHIETEQDWEFLYDNTVLESGTGPANISLEHPLASGTYSVAISGTYHGVYCADTLEDYIHLDIASCCDSMEGVFIMSQDTFCITDSVDVSFGQYAQVDSFWMIINDSIVNVMDVEGNGFPYNQYLIDTLVTYRTSILDAGLIPGCYAMYAIVSFDTLGGYCQDTIMTNFCIYDTCCDDSLVSYIDFSEDTLCNGVVPFLYFNANYNFNFGIPDMGFYGYMDISTLGSQNYNPITGLYSYPMPFGFANNTSYDIFAIPYLGDSLAVGYCVEDTLWTTLVFEDCDGPCDTLGMTPNINWKFEDGMLSVTDASFSIDGFHLVEFVYEGQYYTGTPGSTAQFEVEEYGCAYVYVTMSYYIDDLCCEAVDSFLVCIDCEALNLTADFVSSNVGDDWQMTYSGNMVPDVLSWEFPDGTQLAGNVADNPQLLSPSWYDAAGTGGVICVRAVVNLSDSTPCCCTSTYCDTLVSQEEICEEATAEFYVDIQDVGNNTRFFDVFMQNSGGQSIFSLSPTFYIHEIIWDFGDGTLSNGINQPTHSYLCDATEWLSYMGAVMIDYTFELDSQKFRCVMHLPFTVKIPPCNQAAATFKVYPNPSQDWLNIDFNGIDVSTLSFTIMDMLGKEVYGQSKIVHAVERIHVNQWSKGSYIIHLRDDKEVYTIKFVKE